MDDLSKSIDIFDFSSKWNFEKSENEMTGWINKNKKTIQSHKYKLKKIEFTKFCTDAKFWNSFIWIVFVKRTSKCQKMWWWVVLQFFNAQKKKVMNNECGNEKLSSSDNYF